MTTSGHNLRATFLAASALALCLSAVPASAQSATAAAPAGNQEAIETVVVTGQTGIAGGLMKNQNAAESMSSITPAAIAEKLTVASPLQLTTTLPGANFGSSDAFGLSIRNFLSVRGLDQSEIGFLVDGVPGGDIATYFPYSETWADNENISDITLTPGNSRLQDPILSASGGEFIESIRAPHDEFGGQFSSSAGSFNGWRIFGGLDSGYIGNTGLKGYLSYSHTENENYVGPGNNVRDHVDFRLQEDWSNNAKSTLFVSFNHLDNARIPILTLAQATDGINNDRLSLYQYSPTYTAGVTTNYYNLNQIHNYDTLIASNNDVKLNDNWTLHVTPYFKYKLSNSDGETTLSPTSVFNGNQLVTPVYDPSILQAGRLFLGSNLHYFTHAEGVSAYIDGYLSPTNYLSAGYWFQHGRIDWRTWLNPVNSLGQAGFDSSTALHTASGALISGTYDAIDTYTNQVFIGDTQTAFDGKLSVTLGFKELFYTANVQNFIVGAAGKTSATWSEPMPRLLVSYDIDDDNQVYGNITTNSRMPNAQTTYVTSFSVATGGFSSVGNTAIKPEYTISEQIGYRYKGIVNLDVSAFHMNLQNHQIQGLSFINGVSQNTSIQAGGESIKGATAEVSTHSYYGFSLYGNAQYLNGTFEQNIPLRGDFLNTKGKQMVESPNWITNLGGRYEIGDFFASVTYKYVSKQYSTFVNDQVMPSYNTVDLALGYNLPDVGGLKDSVLRFNATNLGNKSYIASVASVAPNGVATTGLNGTAMPAGTPIYYIGAPFAAMVTLSTKF